MPQPPPPQENAVPVPWYREDQWDLLRRHAPDADEFETTYEEYAAGMRTGEENLRRAGLNPYRVWIDVAQMLRWCREKGYDLDGDSRASYIGLKCNGFVP